MNTDQLSGRELDAAVAEKVMGARWCVWPASCHESGRFLDLHWKVERVGIIPLPASGDEPLHPRALSTVPYYSSSIEAAMRVEDRIAELGLTVMADYFNALARIVAQSITERTMQMFDLVHATAEQRCRAALSAMEDKKSD